MMRITTEHLIPGIHFNVKQFQTITSLWVLSECIFKTTQCTLILFQTLNISFIDCTEYCARNLRFFKKENKYSWSCMKKTAKPTRSRPPDITACTVLLLSVLYGWYECIKYEPRVVVYCYIPASLYHCLNFFSVFPPGPEPLNIKS